MKKQRAAGLECKEMSESRRMRMRRKTRGSISYKTEENLANLKTFVKVSPFRDHGNGTFSWLQLIC